MNPRRIAVVITDGQWPFADLAKGLHAFAQTQPNWKLRLFTRIRGSELDQWCPDGIIVHAPTPRAVAGLRRLCRFVVSIEGADDSMNLEVDQSGVGRLAAEHLLERGFRSVSCLAESGPIHKAREHGFLEAVGAERGVEVVPFRHKGQFRWRRLPDWLAGLPRPAGVFVTNDQLGLAVADAASDAGISIPHELALIAVGNCEPLFLICHPTLSSVTIPYRTLAYSAAQLLFALLEGAGRKPPVVEALQPSIAARDSTDAIVIPDPTVADAIRHIRNHAHERIDIPRLVRRLHISRRNLEQRFRASVGRTLLDEIHRVRIEMAKRALVHTDEPMPQIAERCGFRNAVQLSVVFSRETGMAPTRFRQRSRRLVPGDSLNGHRV